MILSIYAFSLAVALYAIHELCVHGKIRWSNPKNMRGFWGEWSYDRKYKLWKRSDIVIDKVQAPENWYYRLIKSKYVERWPTSTWLTVMFTDAPHLLQFFYCILFCISAVSYEREFGFWIDLGVYWGVWHLSFWLVYNSLQKGKAKIA